MRSAEEIELSKMAPCLPLEFLLVLKPRAAVRKQWPAGTKDSAIFFRLWDLFDTLREPEVIAVLNPRQRDASATFHRIMNSLPWQELPAHPHIKELSDDNLVPLMEAGQELYDALSDKPLNG